MAAKLPGIAAKGGEKCCVSNRKKCCSDVQKVASGKFLCVEDRRNRENCERT